MASAVATETENVTEQQSFVMLRNLARITYSTVLYTRGSFPEEHFISKNVHGLSLKSLGGPGCEGHAKTIMGWLEHGCFDALGKGYLKKAVLCIAADQSSKEVLEAWSISVAWHTDANGVEHPTLQTGGPRSKRTLALKSPRVGHKYTMNYARKTSQALLRQMMTMLQTLPTLPPLHWISMRLLYRDVVTPADYEPAGFQRAPDHRLLFRAKPLQMAIGAECLTGHNTLRMDMISANLGDAEGEDGISAPNGVTKAAGGVFEMDYTESDPITTSDGANSASAAPEGGSEEEVQRLLPAARAFLRDEDVMGELVTAPQLGRLLRVTRFVAEEVLVVLERENEVSRFKPEVQARHVQLGVAQSAMSGLSEAAGSSTEGAASDDGESSSPVARRPRKPEAPTPTTPRTLKRKADEATPAQRKASRTPSVPSTPRARR